MERKYNLRTIMKTAHQYRKEYKISMGTALKISWRKEKALKKAEELGKNSGWNYKTFARGWDKYGKHRIYISFRTFTNAWNPKRNEQVGWIDCETGDYNFTYYN